MVSLDAYGVRLMCQAKEKASSASRLGAQRSAGPARAGPPYGEQKSILPFSWKPVARLTSDG